jgi:hypothetical protein
VTPDHVSPEAPWPYLSELAAVTAEEGFSLVPRLGLTLVRFSAQREHFLSHVVGCFADFSDKNGSG